MARKAPQVDPAETVRITKPKKWAAGVPAVVSSFRYSVDEMGLATTVKTLRKTNQHGGVDCPGCAWPDPDHPKLAEFCENGAKHVAAASTQRFVDREFFALHPISELRQKSDWWLEEQGRLTEPMVKRPGSDHYEPISWDDALDLVAGQLNSLDSPDEAVFYTAGRTSNEAAFMYQTFVRAFGTNNLPDCANLCHESTGTALKNVIGIGKGSVTAESLEKADLIIIAGQNPGSNHPRMLVNLEKAKRNGSAIVAVNPLPEAGLLRFRNPQNPKGVLGNGTQLADDFLQVRLAGDHALFLGLGRLLLEAEEREPGKVLDHDFIDTYTDGFDQYAAHVKQVPWDDIEEASGLKRSEIARLADRMVKAKSVTVCWALGLTQHKDAVACIQELCNVLFLGGNIGREGAGVLPVRGHSNVQGTRTMGIAHKMPATFLDKLGQEFDFEPARQPGWDATSAVTAIVDGRAKVIFSVSGNLIRAISDINAAERGMSGLRMTVSVATKLNRSHVVTGDLALILPALGRMERDVYGNEVQALTMEDSMGTIHASRGVLEPASSSLRSEVAIVCGLARRTLGDKAAVDWERLGHDYVAIRDHISHVIPGFDDFNRKAMEPAGFLLPHGPRDHRKFATESGKARFTVNELHPVRIPEGRLLLQTMRSHDQFNTTIYSNDDRYRGIHGTREVLLVNPEDIARLGFADGERVDIFSEWTDGVERCLRNYRLVAYPTSRQSAATYFPEGNVLVPLGQNVDGSNQPVFKSVVIRLERPAAPSQAEGAGA